MDKPSWMAAHEEADNERFTRIETSLAKIEKMLEPIVETYQTVATLGKWSKIGLGFLLLLLSVIFALKGLFTK